MQIGTDSSGSSAPPTNVRWGILLLLMAVAFSCHFNRIAMSVAGTEKIITKEKKEKDAAEASQGEQQTAAAVSEDTSTDAPYKITADTMSWVYFAYLVVYTICMTPGGWVIDRFGVKFALAASTFGTGVFAIATGLVGSMPVSVAFLASLIGVRGIVGFFAAPTHPSLARAVGKWFPQRSASLINGIVVGTAVVGIASTYTLFGALIDLLGWPSAFIATGVATLVLTLVWVVFYANSPAEHTGANDAEVALIGTHSEEPIAVHVSHAEAPPWYSLFWNVGLIALTLSYAAVSYFQYMFFYWVEFYFEKGLELDTETSRHYSTIITLSMAVGMFLGGAIADRCSVYIGSRWARAAVAATGLLIGMICLLLGWYTTAPQICMIWFSLSMFGVGLSEGPTWASAIDIGGLHGGKAAGILNTGGNVGGMTATKIVPNLKNVYGWEGVIYIASAICVFGALMWLGVSPAKRATEEAKA